MLCFCLQLLSERFFNLRLQRTTIINARHPFFLSCYNRTWIWVATWETVTKNRTVEANHYWGENLLEESYDILLQKHLHFLENRFSWFCAFWKCFIILMLVFRKLLETKEAFWFEKRDCNIRDSPLITDVQHLHIAKQSSTQRQVPWSHARSHLCPLLSSLSSLWLPPDPCSCWQLRTPWATGKRKPNTTTSTRQWLWRMTQVAAAAVTAYSAWLWKKRWGVSNRTLHQNRFYGANLRWGSKNQRIFVEGFWTFFYYSILFSLLIYFDNYDDDDVVAPQMYFIFVENVAKLNVLHERKFVTLSVFSPLALVWLQTKQLKTSCCNYVFCDSEKCYSFIWQLFLSRFFCYYLPTSAPLTYCRCP